MLDLSTLESHDDPQVRALVRELRAARDVVEYHRDTLMVCLDELCDFEGCILYRAYDAAKEPAE